MTRSIDPKKPEAEINVQHTGQSSLVSIWSAALEAKLESSINLPRIAGVGCSARGSICSRGR